MLLPFPSAEKTIIEIQENAIVCIEKIKPLKELVIKSQNFERAEEFRQIERVLEKLVDVTKNIIDKHQIAIK